jgi:hypothetical protein
MPSAHPRLRIARLNDDASAEWAQTLRGWLAGDTADGNASGFGSSAFDAAACRSRLAAFIPEYRPR